ncbi:nucleoside 2-deoxyribosyltransferase [Chloroflexota bacterium]|nr:nucleoside 2-deoxyribosyltransferase [Chloroflexota bacterium]
MPKTTQSHPKNEPYTIYAAGGLFTYRELAMNLAIKEAIWEQSSGKYQLILPQSEQPEGFEHPDVSIQIRNTDLWHVMRTDLLLAQFDGLELDAGTVAEYMMAKFLAKPTVILRSDSRRMENAGFDEPYNLMLKNYPRTVVLHIDSLTDYLNRWEKIKPEKQDPLGFGELIRIEKQAMAQGVSDLAARIIAAFDEALEMTSPYSEAMKKEIYQAARLMPGSGFDQFVSEDDLEDLISRLQSHGSL